jgi:hypothetical protein
MPTEQMKYRASIGITFGITTIKNNWGEIMLSDSPQYFILHGRGSGRTVNPQLYTRAIQ